MRGEVLATLGLGSPRDADRFSGAGAGLGFAARLRNGVFLGTSMRMLGRRIADAGLLRTRFGLGAGYVPRWRALELEVSGWLTAEPWWVRRAGAAASFDTSDGGSDDVRPLWGVALRLAPGLRWQGRRVALRVGAFVELAVSSMLGNGARVPRIRVVEPDDPPPAARLGGVETSFGLELTPWFAPR